MLTFQDWDPWKTAQCKTYQVCMSVIIHVQKSNQKTIIQTNEPIQTYGNSQQWVVYVPHATKIKGENNIYEMLYR